MRKNKIYVKLRGRIGNQLFIYALARAIQLQSEEKRTIILDDSEVLELGWENSLTYYNLSDIEFVHSSELLRTSEFFMLRLLAKLYRTITKKMDYMKKYHFEKHFRKIFQSFGYIVCENGYLPYKIKKSGNILVDGYFQSETYFHKYAAQIKKDFSLKAELINADYSDYEKIKQRNSICISIKVEHNVGSELYDVCTKQYWKSAIEYMKDKVENPLFFVCSDNVEYVKENLICCEDMDVIFQEKSYSVPIALEIMSSCKHFIIGNTTFGWWAQYLSDYEKKVVVAPSSWMLVDMPIHIYQDGWILIDGNGKRSEKSTGNHA